MEFSRSFSTIEASSKNSDSAYKIKVLSKPAIQVLIEILEGKRRDCINAFSSQMISENKIFIQYIKNSLSKYDQKASEISDQIYSYIIKTYLDNEDLTNESIQKLIIDYQLSKMQSDINLPLNLKNDLDTLLSEHIATNSQLFPLDSRLMNFINHRIPAIFDYFTKELLEDYIILIFYSSSSVECTEYSIIEIRNKLESSRSENEISKDILNTIKIKLASINNIKEKIKFLKGFVDNISDLVNSLIKRLRKKGNNVLYMVNVEILITLESFNGDTNIPFNINGIKLRKKNLSIIEYKQNEAELKYKIILEQIRILNEFNTEIFKLEQHEEVMKSTNLEEIEVEKAKIRKDIQKIYSNNDKNNQLMFFKENTEVNNNKKLRNYNNIRELHQEFRKINEIYLQNARKLKNSCNTKNGINSVLEST